jgi:hypothetical protein
MVHFKRWSFKMHFSKKIFNKNKKNVSRIKYTRLPEV